MKVYFKIIIHAEEWDVEREGKTGLGAVGMMVVLFTELRKD